MTAPAVELRDTLVDARENISLVSLEDQQRLFTLAEFLSSYSIEHCKALSMETSAPLEFKIATLLAESRLLIEHVNQPLRLGIVFAMWGEHNRLRPASGDNPNGEDALRVKIAQLNWLFESTPIEWTLYAVDDGCPHQSGSLAREIADDHPLGHHVQVLHLADAVPTNLGALNGLAHADDSRKGGAVILGCEKAIANNADAVIYTDADNSVHLGQLGLLLGPYLSGSKIVFGNRKDARSVLVKQEARWGPGIILLRHMQRMVGETVFAAGIRDTQAAFKLFDSEILKDILDARTVFDFSFDTDWLLAAIANNIPLTTTPFAFIDSAAESASITQGPMSTWECLLKGLVKQVRKHQVNTNEAMCRVIDQELETVADFESIIDTAPPQLDGIADSQIGNADIMSPEEIRDWIQQSKQRFLLAA